MAAWLIGVVQSCIPYSYHVSAVQNLADSLADWVRYLRKGICYVPLSGNYCHRSVYRSVSLVTVSSNYCWLVVRYWTDFLFDFHRPIAIAEMAAWLIGVFQSGIPYLYQVLVVQNLTDSMVDWLRWWRKGIICSKEVGAIDHRNYCNQSLCHSALLVSVSVVVTANRSEIVNWFPVWLTVP